MEEQGMPVIDVEDARANLEELIDGLKPGEGFIISVNGTAKVKVIALTPGEIRKLNKKAR